MTLLQDILKQADYYKEQRLLSEAVQRAGESAEAPYTVQSENAVTEETIKELHRQCFSEAAPQKAVCYRTGTPADYDGGYPIPPPEDIPRLAGHLADQIRSSKSTLHPVELAAMAYKRLIDIRPFDEKNEETAVRLLNLILTFAGYLPLRMTPELQDRFDKALSASRKQYDMEPVSRLAAECVIESERMK